MHSIKGKPTYVWLFLLGLMVTMAKVNTVESVHQCLQCRSDKDTNCLKSTFEKKDCKDGVTQCFTKNVNGVITRGCYDESDKPCEAGENCLICKDIGCNNQNICKKCDNTDRDCSQTNVSDAKFNAICKAPNTKCFVNIKDKKVERRCSNDDDKCTDSATCKECTDANCNSGIFPESRRKCFQCSGSNCDTIGSDKNNAKPCFNYASDEKCYATGVSADAMSRGCSSDVEPKPCESTDKACLTCGEDSCNGEVYKRVAKLSCIKCNDTGCADEQTADKAAACESQLLYNQTESCYTQTKGSSVRRGCLFDDAHEECDTDDTCKRCTTNGCNNAKVDVKFTCIVCRSDESKDCWNNAERVAGKTCRTGESSPAEGCFHGIWNGIAIRGCYIDASAPMKVTCKDPKDKQCNMCYTANCNKEKTSGAGSVKVSIALLAVLLTVFWSFK